MPWLELKIDATPDNAALLEEKLIASGALSVTFQDRADQAILEPAIGETPLWHQTQVIGLFDAAIDTRAVNLELNLAKRSNAHWHTLEDRHWEREWIKHFKPLQCGENLWICPSWTEAPNPNATNVKLDPGLAFGTGTHPTTFLCLNWLSKQAIKDQSIIDYGCGSGILAIAALLLEASNATCIDIDPQALTAMKANLVNNDIDPKRAILALPSDDPMNQADIVLANILAGPLIELAPTISKRVASMGKLCLSGILINQADDVINAYANDFSFDPVHVKDEWACLTASKCV